MPAITGPLEDLLGASDPWSVIESLTNDWTDELAYECERRFGAADAEGRKRLMLLLEHAKTDAAHAVLLRRLPSAVAAEAARLLRALNGAGIVVPKEQIVRLFKSATLEAIAAAGISGDRSLASTVVTMLDEPGLGRHAALALAMLGEKQFTADIASRIETAKDLDASGLIVALEVMNDASVVPKLSELLSRADVPYAWDLHHAIWRLTGREPLVRLLRDRRDAAQAFAQAWQGFDIGASARPRLADVRLDEASGCVFFDVLDGLGAVRIDYDPPTPGSSWPRWGKSLFVGRERLFEVGSDCGTCETTLRLTGSCALSAAEAAESIRDALMNVEAVDDDVLRELEPYLTRLRTGHYLARLVDLDIDHVVRAEDSWLTRRAQHRRGDDPFLVDASDVSWPGTEHFQVHDATVGEFPTYGVILPQTPLGTLRPETVTKWEAAVSSGAHPTALVMCWVEQKDIVGEFTERFLVGLVLDGHHKLSAYARLRRPARILAICRLEDSWGPPEDRSQWLREALTSLDEGERARSRL